MKKLFGVTLTAAILLGISITSFAHTPGVNRRQHNQRDRIRQGIRSEELTRREAFRLRAEQAAIRTYERRAKADCHVTLRERRRLDNRLDRASRDIYRQKHDGQDR